MVKIRKKGTPQEMKLESQLTGVAKFVLRR
jgi:hypothetical protein